MIVRIFRVTIRPEQRSEFERDFHSLSVAAVSACAGLIDWSIGQPTQANPDEYAMITRWADETSLVAFAGDPFDQAVIPTGMERYVVDHAVHHYVVRDE